MKDLLKTWEGKESKLSSNIEKSKTDKSIGDTVQLENELKIVADAKNQILELYNSIKK